MKINKHSNIAKIIKHNKAAIEAIVSINPHFNKLKNPVLRAVLAPRITIEDAAKVGKCKISDFFEKLKPLGFEIEHEEISENINSNSSSHTIPTILKNAIEKNKIYELDVRPSLAKGTDPFNLIMQTLKEVPDDTALKIINTFEPIPLIKILNHKGYFSFVETINDIVYTYFIKTNQPVSDTTLKGIIKKVSTEEFETEKNKFLKKLKEIDVREMEMPMPMVSILSELEKLEKAEALFVHHKKIPQYLLPEIEDRNYTVLILEIEEGNVKLLIHK
ncbi:MAG: DUF2249 domain-containing protein [Flavobacteriales bacterium]|nr:DUF2249 domain-containing protein [Flavobacteriales bacterium]